MQGGLISFRRSPRLQKVLVTVRVAEDLSAAPVWRYAASLAGSAEICRSESGVELIRKGHVMTVGRTRASVLLLSAVACGVCPTSALSQEAPRSVPSIRVTFLGTGSPDVSAERFSASILVEAGSDRLLFDAGRGAVLRLQQAGVDPRAVTALFLTHNHSDHVLAVPDVLLTGWLNRRVGPLPIFGPAGTKDMIAHILAAYQFDIHARILNGRTPPEVTVQEIVPGQVFDRDGVVVRAFEVDHGDIKPAFGYRIESGGRSLVLSGDTRYSENLIQVAKGADVLVHEVALSSEPIRPEQQYVLGVHTSPERAAEVFRQVNPRLAVYSHIILQNSATEEQVMNATKKGYAGRLEMASDLMVVEIGSDIRVIRPR
jgi:ribonuclease Z